MTDEDTRRRLVRLKRKPAYSSRDDDSLQLAIEDATAFFLEYTHLIDDPGKEVDSLICELAVFSLNQEGIENVQSASEGGLSRSYYDGVPPMLMHRLNGHRRIWGL